MLASNFLFVDAEANLRIAGDGAGAGAWNVAEDEVVFRLQLCFCGVVDFEFDPVAYRSERSTHGVEPALADVPCGDCGFGIAFGEDGGFAAGRGTGVEDLHAGSGEFGDKLRALVLNPEAAPTKCLAADNVARYDAPSSGEEF